MKHRQETVETVNIYIYIYIQKHPDPGSLRPKTSSKKVTPLQEAPGGSVRGAPKLASKIDLQ